MVKKMKMNFPKGFFTKPRPAVTAFEALKDVVPADIEDISLVKKSKNKKNK